MSSDQQALLEAIRDLATRMERMEAGMERIAAQVETLDARTGQIAGDMLYLRDRVPLLEERVDNGFRALKSDMGLAFSDLRKVNTGQDRGDRAIDALRREIASIQQRLAALEDARQ